MDEATSDNQLDRTNSGCLSLTVQSIARRSADYHFTITGTKITTLINAISQLPMSQWAINQSHVRLDATGILSWMSGDRMMHWFITHSAAMNMKRGKSRASLRSPPVWISPEIRLHHHQRVSAGRFDRFIVRCRCYFGDCKQCWVFLCGD